ncbi:unnamed protein product [Cuscuta campestris]|uniref:Uncharacterized protein n=1 Tax=Cuscuta campestris TaxID=132261 RepID=A0A484NRQ5_9ASTE|nr:unnamed protein product [Cuscuta campestris]
MQRRWGICWGAEAEVGESVGDNNCEAEAKVEESVRRCRSPSLHQQLQSVVAALKRLGDGPHTHALLLMSHRRKLQTNMQPLRPSGVTHGVAYTAALSHLVFSTIAQGASDSMRSWRIRRSW